MGELTRSERLIIREIRETYLFVDDQLYIPDPDKIVRIQLNQTNGITEDFKLMNITLGCFLHYIESQQLKLAEIKVRNAFEIPELNDFRKDDVVTLPQEILTTMVDLSISHLRALFTQRLQGTPYRDIILPFGHAVQVAQQLFPSAPGEPSGISLQRVKMR